MLAAPGEVGTQLGPTPGAFEKAPQRGYGLFMSTCHAQKPPCTPPLCKLVGPVGETQQSFSAPLPSGQEASASKAKKGPFPPEMKPQA